MSTANSTIIEDASEFWAHLEGQDWRRSTGYSRSDGLRVGAHEYLVGPKHVQLWRSLLYRLDHDAGVYEGEYGGYRYRYLDHAGFKYWVAGRILNRERLAATAGDDDGQAATD